MILESLCDIFRSVSTLRPASGAASVKEPATSFCAHHERPEGVQAMIPELKLWSVDGSSGAEPVPQLSQMPTEWELESVLVSNPGMLEPRLQLVGRQTPAAGGWLDLLAVDGDGRLVVYELKRGNLARDAVTQILDYASALDAMTGSELAKHISDRSGEAGIQRIEDFEQWYADTHGGDDLSRLLPPRMVLIGLGVDAAAERMARFVSAGAVDLSVITFHGFRRDGETLLARQMEVSPGDGGQPPTRARTTAERRRALRNYLEGHGYEQLFDHVCSDIRKRLPQHGIWEQPGSKGIGFQLTEPDDSKSWKTYFGVQAGYVGRGVYSVSVLPQAGHWGGDDALGRLGASVHLGKWTHGGHFLSFKSAEEWEQARSAVLEFVDAVIQSRNEHREDDHEDG